MTTTHVSSKTYLAIWGWLAGLMLVGVLLSELGLPKSTVVMLVLLLSSIKALLVALFYMHLKIDPRLLSLIAVVPIVLLLCSMGVVLFGLLIRL